MKLMLYMYCVFARSIKLLSGQAVDALPHVEMILPNGHFMKFNDRKSLFIVMVETISESIEI